MKLTNNQWAGISPAHPQREGRNIMKTVEIIQTVVQDLAKVVNGETVVLLSRTVTDRRIVVRHKIGFRLDQSPVRCFKIIKKGVEHNNVFIVAQIAVSSDFLF